MMMGASLVEFTSPEVVDALLTAPSFIKIFTFKVPLKWERVYCIASNRICGSPRIKSENRSESYCQDQRRSTAKAQWLLAAPPQY